MDETRYRIKDCLSQALSEIKVWVDGSNMVFIEWGSGKAQIVIEFSFYGPIVFLSSYNSVTEEITEAINDCLSRNHLIQLNEEEITELNRLGLFNCFF